MARGLFVTFEGIDGSGKSTQLAALAQRLRASGREVVATREPGGAPGAEEIRRLLVEGDPGRWSPTTEALLFTAARRDHVERVIWPALARDAVVLCDRYVDSTRAYQGDAAEVTALVERLHALAVGLDPAVTLLLDLPADAAAARAAARGGSEDRFERRGLAFQAALRARFLALADAAPERLRVIDAEAPPGVVAERVDAALAPWFATR